MTFIPQFKSHGWRSMPGERSMGSACMVLKKKFPGSYRACVSREMPPEQKTLRVVNERGEQVWPPVATPPGRGSRRP